MKGFKIALILLASAMSVAWADINYNSYVFVELNGHNNWRIVDQNSESGSIVVYQCALPYPGGDCSNCNDLVGETQNNGDSSALVNFTKYPNDTDNACLVFTTIYQVIPAVYLSEHFMAFKDDRNQLSPIAGIVDEYYECHDNIGSNLCAGPISSKDVFSLAGGPPSNAIQVIYGQDGSTGDTVSINQDTWTANVSGQQ